MSDAPPKQGGWASARERYRDGVQTAVGASAGPYGYSLAIWTSGAVLVHDRGLPTATDALLFMAGNVLAFSVLGALAFRQGRRAVSHQPQHPVLWGSFHFLPIGGAIGGATLLAELASGDWVWPLAGVLVTSIYLVGVGAQIAVFAQGAPQSLRRLRQREREVIHDVREDVHEAERDVEEGVREAEQALRDSERND